MPISKVTTGSISDSVAIDTDTLVVDSTNNRVGIGTSSPKTRLQSSAGGVLNAPSLGSSSTNAPLYLTNNDTAYGLVVGNNSADGHVWLQAQRTDGTATAYNITLNEAGGSVGIGTSSPDTNLDVERSSNDTGGIKVQNTNNAQGSAVAQVEISGGDNAYANLLLECNATNHSIRQDGSGNLKITNGSTERLRIDSSGNVRIGTNTAQITAEKVSIVGGLGIQKTDGYPLGLIRGNTYGQIVTFFNYSGSLVGSINVAASSTSYVTSSDYRLKTAVTYDWDATTRLKQLKPARFEWIADGDDAVPVDGFLAHEVQSVVPEAISGTHNGMRDEEYEVTPAVLDEDGNEITPAVMGTRSVPDYQGIDQSKLVPLLVKTIQELEARIAALEAN